MRQRPDSESGFTIVEVVAATVVLMIGMLGVLAMLSGALRATASNNERVGATNVARELVETARGLDFDDLTSGLVATRLQARGLGSGSPWTILRRGVTYTVTTTTCAFDDPADGYAASPPANACSTHAAGADANGDDFRRTTFTVSWRDAGSSVTKSASQSTLIVNPSGGLGPRITCFTPVSQTYAPAAPAAPAACPAAAGLASTANDVHLTWTTTEAQSLHWEADDGASRADVTGTPNATGGTTFTTHWDIGSSGSGTEVLDGSYVISAQAFDALNIAGETKRADVVLNRRQPYAPPALQGGHDTRLGDWVDLRWGLNSERDILGYRLIWAGPDNAVGNGNDAQVCPLPSASPSYVSTTTQSCADFSPPAGATTYYIVAIDRAP
ncbi:MAG: type IV pilus modification PilV family protein, partial [Solirubrobacteraceae bacterium]